MSGCRPARAPVPSATATAAVTPAARWEALFACPAPQRLPRLVEQAIAWQEQVLAHGDVSPAIAHDLQLAVEHARRQRGLGEAGTELALEDAAGDAAADKAQPVHRSPARKPVGAGARPLPPAASQLLPGSQLVKAYGGRNHVVAVEAGGFRYEGALFTSLSAVAKHITGTHWNGLLFFGLRKRRTYPAKPRRHGS